MKFNDFFIKKSYNYNVFYIKKEKIMGISMWQLILIVVVVILLFGTKKLRTLGSDLGTSIKGFKKAISDEQDGKLVKKEEQE